MEDLATRVAVSMEDLPVSIEDLPVSMEDLPVGGPRTLVRPRASPGPPGMVRNSGGGRGVVAHQGEAHLFWSTVPLG